MTEMRFKMDHQKRGFLVIIDNHKFNDPHFSDLIGSEHDVKNLLHTFVYKLDFELVLKQNQTKAQMVNLMKRFAQEVDHTNVDCFMAVFLSHGNSNEKNEEYMCSIDKCKCSDKCVCAPNKCECSEGCICARVLLADLTEPFKTCRTLDGKPKIFFCDLCRGGNREPGYAKGMSTLSFEDKAIPTTTRTTGSEHTDKTRKKFFSQKEFLFGFGSCRGYAAGKLLSYILVY